VLSKALLLLVAMTVAIAGAATFAHHLNHPHVLPRVLHLGVQEGMLLPLHQVVAEAHHLHLVERLSMVVRIVLQTTTETEAQVVDWHRGRIVLHVSVLMLKRLIVVQGIFTVQEILTVTGRGTVSGTENAIEATATGRGTATIRTATRTAKEIAKEKEKELSVNVMTVVTVIVGTGNHQHPLVMHHLTQGGTLVQMKFLRVQLIPHVTVQALTVLPRVV